LKTISSEYNEVQYSKDEYIGLIVRKSGKAKTTDVSEMILDIDFRVSTIELGL